MFSVLEQSPEPLSQQHLVFGDHDPHGNSAISVVPAPRSLSIRSEPPYAATRSARPLRPEPGAGVAPPAPSSMTETTSCSFSRLRAEHDPARVGVLDGVGEALAGDEVGGRLEPAVEPLAWSLDLDPDRRARGRARGAPGRAQPRAGLEEVRARARAARRSRRATSATRAVERETGALRRGRAEFVLCVTQRQPDRDEPLLGAVVEVALDAAGAPRCRPRRFGPARPRPRRAGDAARRVVARSRWQVPRPRRPSGAGWESPDSRGYGAPGRAAGHRARPGPARARRPGCRRPVRHARRHRARSRAGRTGAPAADRRAPRRRTASTSSGAARPARRSSRKSAIRRSAS